VHYVLNHLAEGEKTMDFENETTDTNVMILPGQITSKTL